MRRLPFLLPLLSLVLLLAACASTGNQMSALQRMQYDYSAAVRWGDFEGAWNLVDPQYREANPMTELHFERYKQVQVSHYRELSSRTGELEALRDIDIGVINRHTMTERSVRYIERWRYDPATKVWWLADGLPDFWAGQ